MRDFAIVKRIEGKLVQVVPLVSEACVTCASKECAGRGKTFSVLNKRSLEIKENSIVRIGVSTLSQYVQGLMSLFVPIFCAVCGYIFAPVVAQRLNVEFSELFHAACVFACFLAASLCVFIVSRSSIHISLPEIIQVI